MKATSTIFIYGSVKTLLASWMLRFQPHPFLADYWDACSKMTMLTDKEDVLTKLLAGLSE